MNRRNLGRLLAVLVAGTMLPWPAVAATTVRVRANHPADVFLDGSRVGSTPMTIPRLRGRHQVRIQSRITGEQTRVALRAGGRRSHRTQTVRARFSRLAPRAWWGTGYRPYGYPYGRYGYDRRYRW